MAVKKGVKKRRSVKKASVESLDKIVDALNADAYLSEVNKRAITRFNRSNTAVSRQERLAAANKERIGKARDAIANAKTPGAREKAKMRLDAAQNKFREVKAELSAAISERRKAERLVKGLYKAMEKARVRMLREYDKEAKAMEKAVDKPLRRRRRTSKKKVPESAD
jgi:hypothetical protein